MSAQLLSLAHRVRTSALPMLLASTPLVHTIVRAKLVMQVMAQSAQTSTSVPLTTVAPQMLGAPTPRVRTPVHAILVTVAMVTSALT